MLIYSTSFLKLVVFFEKVLSDVLNWVFWLILSQFLESLEQRGHNVLVQILSDGKVWVYGLALFILFHLSVAEVRC